MQYWTSHPVHPVITLDTMLANANWHIRVRRSASVSNWYRRGHERYSYRDRFAYGNQIPAATEDAKYIFVDVAALEADRNKAIVGFKFATDYLVSYLVSQLVP